jgi:hypothetical protein
MGWKPWELERIRHPREFRQAIQGYYWRMDWELDCAAFVAFHVMVAMGGSKKQDGTTFQLSDILGRELFNPLVPPTELDAATQEEREMEAAAQAARAERAKLQIWAAMKAREARQRGEDPEPWSGGR